MMATSARPRLSSHLLQLAICIVHTVHTKRYICRRLQSMGGSDFVSRADVSFDDLKDGVVRESVDVGQRPYFIA